MFDTLKDKLQSVFSGLGKRGTLNEGDVNEALREVRLALLDADVALPVVKTFIEYRKRGLLASGMRDSLVMVCH